MQTQSASHCFHQGWAMHLYVRETGSVSTSTFKDAQDFCSAFSRLPGKIKITISLNPKQLQNKPGVSLPCTTYKEAAACLLLRDSLQPAVLCECHRQVHKGSDARATQTWPWLLLLPPFQITACYLVRRLNIGKNDFSHQVTRILNTKFI